MKNLLFFITTFYLLCFANRLYAAKEDTVVFSSGAKLPADRNYVVKCKTNGKAPITAAEIFEVDKGGCLRTIKDRKCVKDGEPAIPLTVRGNDSNGNAYFDMIQLRPSREYYFFLFSDADPTLFKNVMEFLDNDDNAEAEVIYNRILKEHGTLKIKTVKPYFCPEDCEVIYQISDFSEFYTEFYKKVEDKIGRKPPKPIAPTLTHCKEFTIPDKFVRLVNQFYIDCEYCEDTIYKFRLVNKSLIPTKILNLEGLNEGCVYDGYCSLDSFSFYKNNTDANWDKRLKNIKRTKEDIISQLELLRFFYYNYNDANKYKSSYDKARDGLESLLDCLEGNRQLIQSYVDNLNKLKKWNQERDNLLAKDRGVQVPSTGTLTNTFQDGFETRAGLLVRSDFGFVAFGNPWNAPGFWGVSPYVGFHLNFRRYDTEIDWRNIDHKKWPLDYLSFNAGLVLVSLAEEGKREGLIGNKSVCAGFGYALGHGVRLTAGSVFFKKFNSNPSIVRKEFACTPYLGVSIDFRIRDVYTSFEPLFK